MAIYLRGKSYYYDFVHKGQRYTGYIGKVSRTTAKEEEHRKMTEVIEQRLNPAKARKSPRFDTFAEEYLEWGRTNKKPLTVLRNRKAIDVLLPFLGTKKLNEITPWHIEQYKQARKEAGRSALTVNYELLLLRSVLRKAREWGKLSDTPEAGVRKLKAPESRTRFLSEEEEARLLAMCSPAVRRVVQVGLLTGFRRQDLAYLRPEGVDLKRSSLKVAACFAKTGESRTLPIGPRLRAVLEEALSTRGNAPAVLTTDHGQAWTPNGLTCAFRYTGKKAGLAPLGPHVLRHTFASRLVMAGVDLRTVQELMGHKSITMTMRYAHLSPDHKRAAMAALESRFSEKSPADFHNTPEAGPGQAKRKVTAIH